LGKVSPETADTSRWIFLDTETTGLAGGTGTYAFLVGVGWWEPGGFVIEQYFMRDFDEESSLLLTLSERLSGQPVLVTFNGKSFDWPLLETRFRMNRSARIPPLSEHLDLIHPARQLWRLSLPSVSLTELERNILGMERERDIPSRTIPACYFHYLRGGPAEPIVEIIRHNQMDLLGLAGLAATVTQLLQEPDRADVSAGELYGISRILQRRGETALAARVYERALARGLPPAEDRTAKRELALLAKRTQNFARANNLWEDLLGESADGLRAYEELAIYFEHTMKEIGRAASLTREALVKLREGYQAGSLAPDSFHRWHRRLRHRLSRLQRKLNGC
jgi:hypothetical protein